MADGDLPVDSACRVQETTPLPNSVNSAFRAGLSDRDMFPSSSPPIARQLADLFSDGRGHSVYTGPSKQARLADVARSPGAHIARAEDGASCVVAAHAVLQIVRVNNSAATGTNIELGSKNMWWASGFTNEKSPTDVVWAHGNWSSKIITSSRGGDVYMWDINKSGASKFDQRLQLPATRRRPINKLAYSPRSLNMVAAGAHDGHVHLWDFRHLKPPMPSLSFNASGSGSAVRALVLSPVATDAHLAIVGLDNGTLQRWDLRSANRPMETVRLAHVAQVLGMDWLPPSTADRDRGHGWLATCGMDKTIKLWDLSGSSLPSTPSRTLHASFPIRRVFFRPKHDTEIIAIPQADHEHPVEIWDVRRQWLPKWTLQPAGEGDVLDLVPADAHSLWAIHASGAFVQHDLRSQPVSSRPSSVGSKISVSSTNKVPSGLRRTVDDIPRGTVAWDPNGTIAFVVHKEDKFELPYDDVHPEQRPLVAAHGVRYKCPADAAISGIPPSQTLGTAVVPTASADGAVGGGVRYVLDLSLGRERVCEMNAQIAADGEQWRAAQTWEMVRSLLADLHPPETPMPSPPPPTRSPSPPSSDSERRRAQPTPKSQHPSPIVIRRTSGSLRHPSPQIMKTPARSLRKQTSADQESVRQSSPVAFKTPARPASPQVAKITAQSRRRGSDEQEKDEQRDVVTILRSPLPRRDSTTSSISGSRRDSSSVSSLRGDSGDDSFTLPTASMLERRSSTVSLLSDSSSSRGSRRSLLPIGPRPSAVRRPSIIAAAEHAFSAPTVLTLAAIGSGTTSVSTAGTSGIVGSPAVSSLRKHARGLMGGRPSIIGAHAMHRPRSGRSTPNSSNPGSPLKHVVEIESGNGNDNDNDDSNDGMMSRSVSAPHMTSTSFVEPIFMVPSMSTGALPTASSSPSRPRLAGRGRKASLRAEAKTSDESASAADDEGESSAGESNGVSPSPPEAGARRRRRPRSGTLGAPGRRTLAKQDSHASIRTVVAASPPRAEQKLPASEDERAGDTPVLELRRTDETPLPDVERVGETSAPEVERVDEMPVPDVEAAGDVPAPELESVVETPTPEAEVMDETPTPGVEVVEPSSGSLGLALGPPALRDDSPADSPLERGGLVESDASERKIEVESPSEVSVPEYANVQLSESVRCAVRLDEERYRQIGWAAVREELEYYAEKGDVQMCAHLATVAPDELLLAPLRVEQFVKAHVELLERSRMHTQAAYIRKHCTVPSVRERMMSCGRCKKALEGSAFLDQPPPPSGLRTIALCRSCRQGSTRCWICRLPVQGPMTLCPGCSHGGHQECMRKYYPQQPMRALPQPDAPAQVHAEHPPREASPHPVSLLTAAAPSRTSSLLSAASTTASEKSTSDTDEEDSSEKVEDAAPSERERPRTPVSHPCAAGCGHFCWLPSEMPQVIATH